MWATLTVEGEFEQHEGVPTLEQMQASVAAPGKDRGYIECVAIKHGIDMWINEEGKYDDPRRNERATMYAQEAKAIFPRDWIAGNVLFTGTADAEGESTSLTDEQLAYVAQAGRIKEIGFPGSGVWNFTGITL